MTSHTYNDVINHIINHCNVTMSFTIFKILKLHEPLLSINVTVIYKCCHWHSHACTLPFNNWLYILLCNTLPCMIFFRIQYPPWCCIIYLDLTITTKPLNSPPYRTNYFWEIQTSILNMSIQQWYSKLPKFHLHINSWQDINIFIIFNFIYQWIYPWIQNPLN